MSIAARGRAGSPQGFQIAKIEALKGKRSRTRAPTRTSSWCRHCNRSGLTERTIKPVLRQQPDGKTALIRGDVDAWLVSIR